MEEFRIFLADKTVQKMKIELLRIAAVTVVGFTPTKNSFNNALTLDRALALF